MSSGREAERECGKCGEEVEGRGQVRGSARSGDGQGHRTIPARGIRVSTVDRDGGGDYRLVTDLFSTIKCDYCVNSSKQHDFINGTIRSRLSMNLLDFWSVKKILF